jgi:glycerol-3-phosphate dehydrogenase
MTVRDHTRRPRGKADVAHDRDEIDADVVVIGAGVLGCAIASRLAQSRLRVRVLESADDIAEGASKGNAGITSSYYAPHGTLECELLAESNDGWEDLCERLGVPYRRIGALTAAVDEAGVTALRELEAQVRAAGVKCEWLTGDAARAQEPLLTDACVAALYYPDEGIVDPMRLTWAYAELAALNGAVFHFDSPVIGFDTTPGGRLLQAITPRGAYTARYFINAAGLGSGLVSELAGGETIRMWPRKGQYWILDREFGQRMSRIVLPVPMAHSRGIEVAPTTNGSVLLGPDAVDGTDPADTSTDPAGLREVFERTRQLVPSVSLDAAIKTYAGNRPAADEPVRLRADTRVANLVHTGNRSTGVSTSPAFAARVAGLLAEAGLDTSVRGDAVRRLPPVRRLLLDPEPENVPADDVTAQTVVCVCEQVTASEITRALTSAVPARSVEGVRKRCRATGGRCQGSVCLAGVILLCAAVGGVEPGQVRIGPNGGRVGIAT